MTTRGNHWIVLYSFNVSVVDSRQLLEDLMNATSTRNYPLLFKLQINSDDIRLIGRATRAKKAGE